MKNKNGFVTISVVLWLSLTLSIVSSLFFIASSQKKITGKIDKLKSYKKYYAYKDIVKKFEDILNNKLISGDLEFVNVINEKYFLETPSRLYEMKNNGLNDLFKLRVFSKESKDEFIVEYKQILKDNGEVFFERWSN